MMCNIPQTRSGLCDIVTYELYLEYTKDSALDTCFSRHFAFLDSKRQTQGHEPCLSNIHWMIMGNIAKWPTKPMVPAKSNMLDLELVQRVHKASDATWPPGISLQTCTIQTEHDVLCVLVLINRPSHIGCQTCVKLAKKAWNQQRRSRLTVMSIWR